MVTNKTNRGNPVLNSKLILSLVFLAYINGCSKPSPSSSAETPNAGSSLESLFAGSGEMEKTQEERKLQQEKMIKQQKELQKKRLDSYEPHR
ncbi:MAG: hypothetical protein WC450_06865 [Candidatus Omnitrophota bacterium]|jgi:hypothetical protein